MLDEPLGALDRALRTRLLDELTTIFAELELPIIYVTHDQEEAFTVADRVVVMRDGREAASGAPVELWSRPPDAWTARFLGFHNVADAEVHAGTAISPWGTLSLPDQADGKVTLVLRPEALAISGHGDITGTVISRRFHGDHVRVSINTDAGAALELQVRGADLPAIGQRVSVQVDPHMINLLAD
jgi:thiamine transport system ATP-binding protein